MEATRTKLEEVAEGGRERQKSLVFLMFSPLVS